MTPAALSAEFTADVELFRAGVAGAVKVGVELTAAVNGRVRVVGRSRWWTLAVDEAAAPRREGVPPLKFVWTDFSAPDAPAPARQFPSAYSYVDASLPAPAVYLNTAIKGFQSLLLAGRLQKERRRARELVSASIARDVAYSLLHLAIGEIGNTDLDDPIEAPSLDVCQQTCEAIAEQIPGMLSVDEFYSSLGRMHESTSPQRAELWTKIDLAVDKITNVSDTYARVFDEVQYAV